MLYQERSATLAAQRMALSQPALSHKLGNETSLATPVRACAQGPHTAGP